MDTKTKLFISEMTGCQKGWHLKFKSYKTMAGTFYFSQNARERWRDELPSSHFRGELRCETPQSIGAVRPLTDHYQPPSPLWSIFTPPATNQPCSLVGLLMGSHLHINPRLHCCCSIHQNLSENSILFFLLLLPLSPVSAHTPSSSQRPFVLLLSSLTFLFSTV